MSTTDGLTRIRSASKTARSLDLSEMGLTEIHPDIGELTELEFLKANGNRLLKLPKEIGSLKRLVSLDLSNNLLTELPQQLQTLPLTHLRLEGNPDLNIPPEILNPSTYETVPESSEYSEAGIWVQGYKQEAETYEVKRPAGPKAILSFYFEARDRLSKPLNEAKLLIVGQGGVGKTSVVKRLVKGDFSASECKTDGIAIAQWTLPASISPVLSNGEPIHLNIWDFGGQEIMHATHRFFLTERSLYLLVLDARRGENESNIQYWLKMIGAYGRESPVLIVVNRIDENSLTLNETRIRKDYPCVQSFCYVSCLTGEGLPRLKEVIEECVAKLKHVFDRLPLKWFAVKERLTALAKKENYVSFDKYRDVCKENGILTKERSAALLRFLHDLGTVLHYDDPDGQYRLEQTNILNPEWVTSGVYKIINNRELATDHHGHLQLSQVLRILNQDPNYPETQANFIVGMMRRFELCFEFPEAKEELLIPDLLPTSEPDLNWNEAESLRFEYHYDLLPEWIICRFIVKIRRYLTPKETFWRTGVVLAINDNRILVRADVEGKRVIILVTGFQNSRGDALSIIRHTFGGIHESMPGVRAKEMVSLPGEHGATVEVALLNRLIKNNIQIYPSVSGKIYAPSDVISKLAAPILEPMRKLQSQSSGRPKPGVYQDGGATHKAVAYELRITPKFRAIAGGLSGVLSSVSGGYFVNLISGSDWNYYKIVSAILSAALFLIFAGGTVLAIVTRRADQDTE